MTSVDTFEFVPADEESVASDTTSDHVSGNSSSGCHTKSSGEDGGRDEKKVIEKMVDHETFTVQIWRAMVTNVLVFTALAITLVTHTFLANEQQKSFEQAVRHTRLYISCLYWTIYCYCVFHFAFPNRHLIFLYPHYFCISLISTVRPGGSYCSRFCRDTPREYT